MGFSSGWHWIIVLAVVLLVFGTGKLPRLGQDLAKTIKGFKAGMRDDEDDRRAAAASTTSTPSVTTTPSENRPV